MDKKLTILDIARLSGVGKSTVSRVLNQDPKVKQATRDRVEQIIAEHGFVPSKSARAMRSQSQQVVGIIVSRLDSSSENQAVRTMLPLLYQQGFDDAIVGGLDDLGAGAGNDLPLGAGNLRDFGDCRPSS